MTQPVVTDGRTARKVEMMRKVQTAALRLFERHGFEAVTVEAVAAAARVGAATVYRNFGTKERLVLWDEYDPLLLEAVSERLASRDAPLVAICAGLLEALSTVYEADRSRILRRSRLTKRTPSLMLCATGDLQLLRAGLAKVLEPRVRDPLARSVLAAAATGALEASIDAWVESGGRTALRVVLTRAFRVLARQAD